MHTKKLSSDNIHEPTPALQMCKDSPEINMLLLQTHGDIIQMDSQI